MSENTTSTQESIQTIGIPEITMSLSVSEVTTQPTDPNLISEGEPADAKAVGDRFAEIEEDVGDLMSDVSGLLEDVAAIQENGLTTADIDTELATTGKVADAKATGDAIAAAIEAATEDIEKEIGGILYPVGSIYMTTLTAVPESIGGTWVEIKITSTWSDLASGIQNYEALGTGETAGTVHYFRRTE